MGRNVTVVLVVLFVATSQADAVTLQSLYGHYPPSTVAALSDYATPVTGTVAIVTDANSSCVADQIPVGGGSTPCQVAFDGVHWRELRGVSGNTPQAYGGAGNWRMHDGQTYNSVTLTADGSCSSGSGTFTSASGAFTSADIGKILVIGCADGSTTGPGTVAEYCSPLIGTVATVSSTTTVSFNSLAASSGGTGQSTCAATVSSAKWYIGTNNRTALQTCVNTGNCAVASAGVYGAVGGILWNTSNKTLTCSPNTVLFDPMHGNSSGTVLVGAFMSMTSANNNTITGCTMQGTDKFGVYDSRINADQLICIGCDGGGPSNNTITNSTFTQTWGDASIQVGGDFPNPTSNGNQIIHDTFSTSGLFSWADINGNNNVYAFNSDTNDGTDIEPDFTTDQTYSNLVHDNTVTTTSNGKNFNYGSAPCNGVNQSYNTANGCMAVMLFNGCSVSDCAASEISGATQMYNNTMTGPILTYCTSNTIHSNNTKNSGAGGNGVTDPPSSVSPCPF